MSFAASAFVDRDLSEAVPKKSPCPTQNAPQPDLFEERGSSQVSVGLLQRMPDVEELTDQEVVARIVTANMAEVEALCGQVLKRGIGDYAVPALESIWRRFFGFGVNGPMREQRCALKTLAKIGTSLSRQALVRIIDDPDLFPALLPLVLECATEAILALSGQSVTCWLEDSRPEVRESAMVLARNCSTPVPKLALGKVSWTRRRRLGEPA